MSLLILRLLFACRLYVSHVTDAPCRYKQLCAKHPKERNAERKPSTEESSPEQKAANSLSLPLKRSRRLHEAPSTKAARKLHKSPQEQKPTAKKPAKRILTRGRTNKLRKSGIAELEDKSVNRNLTRSSCFGAKKKAAIHKLPPQSDAAVVPTSSPVEASSRSSTPSVQQASTHSQQPVPLRSHPHEHSNNQLPFAANSRFDSHAENLPRTSHLSEAGAVSECSPPAALRNVESVPRFSGGMAHQSPTTEAALQTTSNSDMRAVDTPSELSANIMSSAIGGIGSSSAADNHLHALRPSQKPAPRSAVGQHPPSPTITHADIYSRSLFAGESRVQAPSNIPASSPSYYHQQSAYSAPAALSISQPAATAVGVAPGRTHSIPSIPSRPTQQSATAAANVLSLFLKLPPSLNSG